MEVDRKKSFNSFMNDKTIELLACKNIFNLILLRSIVKIIILVNQKNGRRKKKNTIFQEIHN